MLYKGTLWASFCFFCGRKLLTSAYPGNSFLQSSKILSYWFYFNLLCPLSTPADFPFQPSFPRLFYPVQSHGSLYLGSLDFAFRFVGLQLPTISFSQNLFSPIMVPAQEATMNTNDRFSAVNTHSLSTPSAVNTLYLQFSRGRRDGIQLQIQVSTYRCLHVVVKAPSKSTKIWSISQ